MRLVDTVTGACLHEFLKDTGSDGKTGEKDKGESQDYKGQYENIHSSPPREM